MSSNKEIAFDVFSTIYNASKFINNYDFDRLEINRRNLETILDSSDASYNTLFIINDDVIKFILVEGETNYISNTKNVLFESIIDEAVLSAPNVMKKIGKILVDLDHRLSINHLFKIERDSFSDNDWHETEDIEYENDYDEEVEDYEFNSTLYNQFF